MNSTSLLSINNLSKTYHSILGETTAIENINLNIYSEEFVGIVGPSGCGKSSILNIISKLDKEYKGQIKINKNIKIAYMLQEDALFPWLTIENNVLLGLKIENKLNKENKLYALNLLKKYGLYDFKNMYPTSLSGGMKQRVALIRTLAIKPDILLLDEPFSALDYQTRLKVSNDVYEIIKKERKTVLIVTHDIAEAISMCDRIIVLSKRPATVKKIYNINLDKKSTPINNRESSNFTYYYKTIWKEIDDNV
jgi:NitT/TauT family transport system ATP-binding protein